MNENENTEYQNFEAATTGAVLRRKFLLTLEKKKFMT